MPEPVELVDDVVEVIRGRLRGLEDHSVEEHVTTYDEVHRLLQDALARLDEG